MNERISKWEGKYAVNLTRNETRYIPQKVVDLAYNLGAHEACIKADLEGSCSMCISLMHQALDTHYGHLDNETDVMMAIINDIMQDRG